MSIVVKMNFEYIYEGVTILTVSESQEVHVEVQDLNFR